jgi:hypothetical protein
VNLACSIDNSLSAPPFTPQVISSLGAMPNLTMAASPRTIEDRLSPIQVQAIVKLYSLFDVFASLSPPQIFGYDLSDTPRDLFVRISRCVSL